jgi:N-methylhydantoinase B
VTVDKDGDQIRLDFRESDDQVAGPINCRPSMVAASTYFAVKSLVDPDLPANGGAYRPIEILTREGSLLQARYPAAVGNANGVTSQRIVDTVWGALAQALPGGLNAANAGTITGCTIGGYDPVRDRVFSYVETYGGGQGAMEGADGMSGVHTNMSNTRNSPVEVLENEYPFQIERYELIPDSGGAGTFRGGMGLRRVIRFLAGSLRITTSSDREQVGPWGLNGGLSAEGTKYYVETEEGRTRLPVKYSGSIEKAGTVLFIETAGGGGYGEPRKRDPSRIAADLEKGLISKERAASDYGYRPEE